MEPLSLERRDARAEPRERVVQTALVFELGHRSALGRFHESVGRESLDDSVEIAGGELDDSFRSLRDLFDEAVPVLILLDQREEDEVLDGAEWKELAGID